MFVALFMTLDVHKSWTERMPALITVSKDIIVTCSINLSHIVAEPNHLKMDAHTNTHKTKKTNIKKNNSTK